MAKVIVVTNTDDGGNVVGIYNNLELAKSLNQGANYSFEEQEIITSLGYTNYNNTVSLLFKSKNYKRELSRLEKDGWKVSYTGKYGCTLSKD